MDKARIKAVILILLFLLVLAIAVNLLLDMEQDKREVVHLPAESAAPVETPAPAPLPTEAPAPATPVPTATPAPTPDPYIDAPATPVPTLQPLPAATPAPTASPIPAGEEVGRGTFRSNTGVGLNLRAEWVAQVMDESHVRVTVQVFLDSYSLHITGATNAVNVSVGDSFVSANAPTVDIDDNASHESLLATTEHVVNLSAHERKSYPVQVEYQFGGVYQQKELPVLECGGPIEIVR